MVQLIILRKQSLTSPLITTLFLPERFVARTFPQAAARRQLSASGDQR